MVSQSGEVLDLGTVKLRQLTMGEFIDRLESLDADRFIYIQGGLTPNTKTIIPFKSYRGYYHHLALDPLDQRSPGSPNHMRVGEMFTKSKTALQWSVFQGYHGGEYEMDRDTPLWISRYGYADGTAVVGVDALEYGSVIIRTWQAHPPL